MMYEEFKERMQGYGISCEEYENHYEPVYMMSNLNKDEFCELVKKDHHLCVNVTEKINEKDGIIKAQKAVIEDREKIIERLEYDYKHLKEVFNFNDKVSDRLHERIERQEAELEELREIARKYNLLKALLKEVVA